MVPEYEKSHWGSVVPYGMFCIYIWSTHFGRQVDHQWRKFRWSGQYWVAHWGNVLCTFDNIRFCWCHISFDGKGLGSPNGPTRCIFRSTSRFIGHLGWLGDLLIYTLVTVSLQSILKPHWQYYNPWLGLCSSLIHRSLNSFTVSSQSPNSRQLRQCKGLSLAYNCVAVYQTLLDSFTVSSHSPHRR